MATKRRTELDAETLRRFIAMYTDPKVSMVDMEEVFGRKAGTLYRWGFEYNLKRPKVLGETMLKLELVEKYCRKVSVELAPYKAPATYAEVPEAKRRAVDLVLILGDIHAGSHTKTFDTEVLVARMQALTERVLQLGARYLRDYTKGKLHVHLTGDCVTGERVGYMTTLDELEHAVLTQVYGVAVPRMGQLLSTLAQQWYTEVTCAPGNHGIVGKPAMSAANWDTVVYLALQAQLSKNPAIQFNIEPTSWYNMDTVQGLDWMVTHGDAIRGGNPHGKIGPSVTAWHDSLPEHFDYVSMGHWHELNKIRETFISGTMVTDDEWSRKVVKKDGDCAYWLLAVQGTDIVGANPISLSRVQGEE